MHRTLLFVATLFALVLSACAGAQRHARTPDALTLDGALGNRFVPSGARSSLVARIRLGTAASDPSTHPPINLALVIDTSGSMEGAPIDDARTASLALLDTLRDGDRLAVVTFDSRAELLVPSVTLDHASREDARARIGRMRARGTTDLLHGLRMGIEQVAAHLDRAGVNRVVLLGDGVPNEPQGIEDMAASAGAHGISITALGLGLDYNETLMGAIATRSGGRFHYVDDSRAVASVFRGEVLRLERVVARNAVVTLTPGPDVQIEGVLGQQATRTDQGITINVGDLTEGAARDLVVRINVPSRRAGAPVELLDAQLAWTDPGAPGELRSRDLFLGAHATASATDLEGGRDAEVESVAARVQLAVGTVAVIREARGGHVEEAQRQLDQLLDGARQRGVHGDAYRRQIAAVTSLRAALPSTAMPVTETAGAPPQRAVREAHEQAMSVLSGE